MSQQDSHCIPSSYNAQGGRVFQLIFI